MSIRYPQRRLAMIAAIVACGVLASDHAATAQKVLGLFGSGDTKYNPYRDSSGRFEIEQPAKDWGLVPPGGSAIAIFSRKDRTATLVVDLGKLTEPLAEAEILTNAQIEVDSLKEQQPNAKDFTTEALECKGGKGALIKYSRIGTKGAERVYRYLIGVDRDLYRLDGVVQDALASKYEPILMHMISTFKAPAGPPTTKN